MSETPTQYQIAAQPMAMAMFATEATFALIQRQAQLVAASDLIPKQFQGNVANCAIALEMASRLGASPFAVIQNLDVIHGRPSWRATFLMGLVNNCGRFTPLQFKLEETGPERTSQLEYEDWEGPQGARKKVSRKLAYTYTPTRCVAWARDRSTGEIVEGPPVSYDMAIEEGWVTKAGSKWQTSMRELMLRYRAASFFAKVYASDVMLGMQTTDELLDSDVAPMRDVTPPSDPVAAAIAPNIAPVSQPAEAVPAKRQRAAKQPEPAPQPQSEQADDNAPSEPVEAEVIPPRDVMVASITRAMRDRGLKVYQIEVHLKKIGKLPHEKLTQCSDAELFWIHSNLEVFDDIQKDA